TATMLLTFLLIVVGAATRVYDAGMACPDWPHCYGYYIPFPESKIPGGYIVQGQHYTWWQVLLEWGHRTLAALVGVGLLALWGTTALAATKITNRASVNPFIRVPAFLPLLTATLLLALQIKLGAITVWWSNAPWTVMVHLGNAMLFFAALVWLRRVLLSERSELSKSATRRSSKQSESVGGPVTTPLPIHLLAITFALSIWLTMLIGGYTSSSGSGGVCGGLFTCLGQWWVSPKVDLQQHIHMQHRLWALITTALSIALVILAKRTAPHLRKAALHAHIMLWGQITLGIATLYSFEYYPSLYYPLSIAHLAWGTLLFTAAIGLLLNIYYGVQSRPHTNKS
ncbi:MAG: hypothetical protein EBR79_02985, partial [Proteobacteria bacterium]|nr:hypothetical protein [Pseudomonadota bacterium]